jgi:hypothetical protein
MHVSSLCRLEAGAEEEGGGGGGQVGLGRGQQRTMIEMRQRKRPVGLPRMSGVWTVRARCLLKCEGVWKCWRGGGREGGRRQAG